MQNDAVTTALELDGDYVLGEVLGTGGMGIIYSAIQRSLGRRVAIKVPHPELAASPFVNSRFRAEARASGRIDHRNVARVINFGGTDGALFLVMQHVAGVPLEKLVNQHGAMGTSVASEVCMQILAGLHATHTAGIIHADMKSGNVLIETMPDGSLRAVLIDFGLARFRDEPALDDARMLSGTPDYLAPELIRGGTPSVASDIYATGVVLYELLTGSTPFGGGTSKDIFLRQLGDAVVPPSLRSPDLEIPSGFDAIVVRALAKDPAARFATAAEFAAAVQAATPITLVLPTHLARGTERATKTLPFSTESATRDWQQPARRVVTGESASIHKIRVVVNAAVATGEGDAIVTSYLELVRALVDGHQLDAAVAELERGLVILRPGVSAGATPAATWRLQLCLAALYSGLGQPMQARRAAMRGQDDAVRAASTLGEDRANELLLRLARHG